VADPGVHMMRKKLAATYSWLGSRRIGVQRGAEPQGLDVRPGR
jgi:hypothetical protein